jgi:hypothetical protein
MVFNPEAAFSRIKMLHSVAFQGRIFSIVLQNWKLGTPGFLSADNRDAGFRQKVRLAGTTGGHCFKSGAARGR